MPRLTSASSRPFSIRSLGASPVMSSSTTGPGCTSTTFSVSPRRYSTNGEAIMSATRILPVAIRNAGDLATICAGEGAKSDPLWERATKAKRQWVRDRLAELGTFAWVAYNLSLIHISEPTRLGMSSYAVFCLKKKKKNIKNKKKKVQKYKKTKKEKKTQKDK